MFHVCRRVTLGRGRALILTLPVSSAPLTGQAPQTFNACLVPSVGAVFPELVQRDAHGYPSVAYRRRTPGPPPSTPTSPRCARPTPSDRAVQR